ncbi:hypothetical protein Tco_0324585 [Tanacetum coccineum]
MDDKNKDMATKRDTSEFAKEIKEVIKPTKPSVILKYQECVHFSTTCMIKGTDHVNWDDIWYISNQTTITDAYQVGLLLQHQRKFHGQRIGQSNEVTFHIWNWRGGNQGWWSRIFDTRGTLCPISHIKHPLNGFIVFKRKLQGLKACLKNWRQVVRLTEGASVITLRARLDQLDLLAESGPLSLNNIEIRFNIVKDLMCFPNPLIKDLKQKAKCKWAKDGDENSGFFHGIINSRLNRSRLNGLNILGSWVTEPSLITEHIFHVFEKKFKETNLSRPTFSSNLFNHLSLEDITFLDRPFSNQEIKDPVLGCGGDKAPGQTGSLLSLLKVIRIYLVMTSFILCKNLNLAVLSREGATPHSLPLYPKLTILLLLATLDQ